MKNAYKLKQAIFYCLFFLCYFNVQAQQNKQVHGLILEKTLNGNFQAIPKARIQILHSNIESISDTNGRFEIPFILNSFIHIHAIGYSDDTVQIHALDDIKILLISKTHLDEVRVGVERKSTEVLRLESMKIQVMGEKELYKAACCNLSESFETNPAVDVSFPDALSGTKQIQMLGLGSQYIQLTQEAIPSMRGIASGNAWAYTPGSWLNSIQLTKGIGSVVNGFESIAGQINTELQKPSGKDNLFFNYYRNIFGREELNANIFLKKYPTFQSGLLLHFSHQNQSMDYNHDMFRDMPTGFQWNALYRWMYNPGNGFIFQGGIRFMEDAKIGGHMDFSGSQDSSANHLMYGMQIHSQRQEAWIKTAWNFSGKVYKSVGWQNSFSHQLFDNYYGFNTYNAHQQSWYSNLIYQSIISNTNHKFRTGLSFQSDEMNEQILFNTAPIYFNTTFHPLRTENVAGAYFEYTYNWLQKLTLVGGIRYDYHNYFKGFFTPRLHIRYAINENNTIRLSAGSGRRTPNPFAESNALFSSNRLWVLNDNALFNSNLFKQEEAWNIGLSYVCDFKINKRKGQFTMEAYQTRFLHQIVIDREDFSSKFFMPALSIYSLDGQSISNSFQAQLDYEIIRRLDIRAAYRLADVWMQYQNEYKEVPMIARHRAFINIAYNTRSKWTFDWTTSYTGTKRLPQTSDYLAQYILPTVSPAFFISNFQIGKSVSSIHLDVYIGAENIFDFKQDNPILNPQQPFSRFFDATMNWGPVLGRMIYFGLRYRI